jgi:hypothetical protein
MTQRASIVVHKSTPIVFLILLTASPILTAQSPTPTSGTNSGMDPRPPAIAHAVASSAQHDPWEHVRALAVGTRIRVVLDRGLVVTGTLEKVTNIGVDVRTSAGRTSVTQPTIARVEQLLDRRVRRGAVRGFLIGAAAGAAVGLATVESNRGEWTTALALGWGGVGAALGAAGSAVDSKSTLIYERATGAKLTGRPAPLHAKADRRPAAAVPRSGELLPAEHGRCRRPT